MKAGEKRKTDKSVDDNIYKSTQTEVKSEEQVSKSDKVTKSNEADIDEAENENPYKRRINAAIESKLKKKQRAKEFSNRMLKARNDKKLLESSKVK